MKANHDYELYGFHLLLAFTLVLLLFTHFIGLIQEVVKIKFVQFSKVAI